MRKIYKTKLDDNPQTLSEKLRSYAKEKINKSFKSTINISKGSLAVLVPLAAAGLVTSDVNAQCGNADFNPIGGVFGDGQVDVDGDLNPDFNFDIVGNNLFITAIGTMSMGIYTSQNSYAVTFQSGSALSGSNSYVNNGYAFVNTLTTARTVYVPVQSGGQFGFIEIIIDGAGGFTIGTQSGIAETIGIAGVVAGDCATLLPVELTKFDSEVKDDNVQLNWMTELEINNHGFEVQRSTDGENFYKVGWIDGSGTIEGQTEYRFMDDNVRTNVLYYYRLKQMDFNGQHEFSKIINAEVVGKDQFDLSRVFPNPVSADQFSLEIGAQSAESMQIDLYDSFGKVILSQEKVLIEGMNIVNIQTDKLVNGTYFMKLTATDFSDYRKVVVQK